jgi:hypothetical protein
MAYDATEEEQSGPKTKAMIRMLMYLSQMQWL